MPKGHYIRDPKKRPKKYPTLKQKAVFDKVVNGGKSISKAMREAGYAPSTAARTEHITASDGWKELMKKHLSDESLSKAHEELLNAKRLDHMVFPPFRHKKDEEDEDEETDEDVNEGENFGEQLTDADIRTMLTDVGCTVRKIVHGEQARHVYFWSMNDKARKDALDMAYKLKGHYEPEKHNVKHEGLNLADLYDRASGN